MLTFSNYFRLNKSQFELDFVNIPVNNGDIPLFIDPYALSLNVDIWGTTADQMIISFFQRVIDCIRDGKDEQALYMLDHLREPNQTKLGLSKGKKSIGKGVSGIQAKKLFNALKNSRAISTGVLQHLEECDLFIDGIANDKISDICTNIIKSILIEYTQNQCKTNNVPTRSCNAGFIWNPESERWESKYFDLPIYKFTPLILVPKSIVRYSLSLLHDEYYRMFVLEFLQEDYHSKGALLRVLKNGETRPPFKKAVKEKHPKSKEYLYTFSKEHPKVLENYKKTKAELDKALSNSEIIEISKEERTFNFDQLESEMRGIPLGRSNASKYHDKMLGVLESIFYPDLYSPTKEEPLHAGRKRVDITFTNNSRNGFFFELPNNKSVVCPFIYIECKNYASDPENPELDQLSSRFSTNRGKFGILVCRKFQNKQLFIKRCRDTADDGRGYIIALDDNDISLLIKMRKEKNDRGITDFFNERYKELVM